MAPLLELYQKHCHYQITDNVQLLDFTFDIERLRKELFNFIINNNFGFSAVSLRLPENETNYISSDETLESGSIDPYGIYDGKNVPSNTTHNKDYSVWHPQLVNSYISTLVPKIENLYGLHIGRIRLGWLHPTCGYEMHADLEPMRFHIPLFTNNLSYIIHDHKLYHMQYGKLYHLITTNIHTAWNFGRLPRLHLIFSTYADDMIDAEILKLTEQTLGEGNLLDQLQDQGIDKYGLERLLIINNSLAHVDLDKKQDNFGKIKKIIDLITKN
jgi:hypothetical protein